MFKLTLAAAAVAFALACGPPALASETCPMGTVAEITAKAADIGLPLLFSTDKADIAATRTYSEKKYGPAPFDWAEIVKVGFFKRHDNVLLIFLIDKDDCTTHFLLDTNPNGAPSFKPSEGAPMLLPHGLRAI